MRKIVEVMVDGCRLVGTCHSPSDTDSVEKKQRPGLLFFNSGFLPRSPVGDLTTHLSDHFAGMGITSFRFDMPGLGDSEGDLPGDVATFFSSVLAGAHGAIAEALSRELVERFNLSGIALGGLCGGAVTSAYAAAGPDAGHISGIFLLDPSLQLMQSATGATEPKPVVSRNKRKELYQEWRMKVLATGWGQFARRHYLKVKRLLLRSLSALRATRGDPLPADANRPLIHALSSLRSKKLPMLVLMAGSEEQRTEKFNYLKYLAGKNRDNFIYEYLAETTHSFVEANGEALVTGKLKSWMTGLAGASSASSRVPATQT